MIYNSDLNYGNLWTCSTYTFEWILKMYSANNSSERNNKVDWFNLKPLVSFIMLEVIKYINMLTRPINKRTRVGRFISSYSIYLYTHICNTFAEILIPHFVGELRYFHGINL